jgi:hypothetical protein
MSAQRWPRWGVCLACHADFLVWRKWPHQRFCSRVCVGRTFGRPMVLAVVICARPACDTRFRQRRASHRYCSHSCSRRDVLRRAA